MEDVPFDIDDLKPSEEIIKGWKRMVEKVNVRNFQVGVAECEVER